MHGKLHSDCGQPKQPVTFIGERTHVVRCHQVQSRMDPSHQRCLLLSQFYQSPPFADALILPCIHHNPTPGIHLRPRVCTIIQQFDAVSYLIVLSWCGKSLMTSMLEVSIVHTVYVMNLWCMQLFFKLSDLALNQGRYLFE